MCLYALQCVDIQTRMAALMEKWMLALFREVCLKELTESSKESSTYGLRSSNEVFQRPTNATGIHLNSHTQPAGAQTPSGKVKTCHHLGGL